MVNSLGWSVMTPTTRVKVSKVVGAPPTTKRRGHVTVNNLGWSVVTPTTSEHLIGWCPHQPKQCGLFYQQNFIVQLFHC